MDVKTVAAALLEYEALGRLTDATRELLTDEVSDDALDTKADAKATATSKGASK